jgi:hypothetical protein
MGIIRTGRGFRLFLAGLSYANLLVTLSCSPGEGGGNNVANESGTSQPLQAPELQGVWESNCFDADAFGLTESARVTFDRNRVIRLSRVSSSGSCEGTAVEIMQEGVFAKGAEISPSVPAIDLQITSIRIKPISADGVAILRLGAFCGISDWQEGVEREVTALTGKEKCFPKVPTTIFNVYTIESGRLYFGDTPKDMTDILNRPVALNREIAYVRRL